MSVTPINGTASTAVSSVTYQPFGPVSGYTLGNGQTIVRSYDANYRLTDLTSPAFNLHLARDAMGDITAIGNAPDANPATETYAYDPLYRLLSVTEASGTVLESVTYNPTGDRLSKTGSGLDTGTYSYNSNTHQLNAAGSNAFTADADGNTTAMTQAGSTYGFGYSDRNRMTVAQLAGATVGSYTYNALGQRIQKVVNSTTERYDYNEASQMLDEYGVTNRDYIWMDGIPVANVDTSGSTSTVAYVTADQLGTARAIANSSGVTEWQLPYQGNPWSEVLPTSSGYTYNLGLPSQYFDAETGQMNWGFRTYNPGTGRSPQSDPKGMFGGQSSTYAYVNNSPLSNIDPLGLESPRGACGGSNNSTAAWTGCSTTPPPCSKPCGCKTPSLGNLAMMAGTEVVLGGPEDPLATIAVDLEEAAIEADAAAEAANIATRPLTEADMGLTQGSLTELQGTYSVTDGVANVQIDMIQGQIGTPFSVMSSLSETAASDGANTLNIQGTIANEQLFNILSNRYGMTSQGAVDSITLPLK